MTKSSIRGSCIVAAFTVVLYLGLSNLDKLSGFMGTLTSLMMPFLIGLVIAFVLNGVMNLFEHRVYHKLAKSQNPRARKMLRPLSLATTYLLMIVAISILVTVVVPQLADSVMQLSNNVPGYLNSLTELAQRLSNDIKLPAEVWQEISAWFQSVAKELITFVVNFVPRLLNMVISFGGSLFTGFIGIIVSIYILSSKEKLLSQMARLNRAFMPEKAADRVADAAEITGKTFSNYVTGQLTDALIVGVVSVIGLSLLGFQYAMLIGVVMGITNIIPFFGPFIGAVPGFIITFMVSPVRALWYILFVVVVQQVDGNIIAPKIIGESVGLPPLWVLFGVTVGGGLLGMAGMVLGTPIFAVLYILLGKATRGREAAEAEFRAKAAPTVDPPLEE